MIFRKFFFVIILGWASFVFIGAEAIAADDIAVRSTRERQVVNGDTYPWRAIGRVQWAGVANRAHCTGALIGRKLVLTAAHCLFDPRVRDWVKASNLHFLAGYDRGVAAAYSIADRYVVSEKFDVQMFEAISNYPHDWALVVLRDPIGDDVGYLGWQAFGVAAFNNAFKKQSNLILAGYPQDRREVLSISTKCKIEGFDFGGSLFVHSCASVHGDSGGPFAVLRDGKLSVIGLTNAAIDDAGVVKSSAVPLGAINDRIMALLRADGTLVPNQSAQLPYGWMPADN